MDDEALIAAFYDGDNEALQTLYQHYHAHLIVYFINGGLAADQAEELAQQVWVQIMNTRYHLWGCTAAPFNPAFGVPFYGWLYAIAYNLLCDGLHHLGHGAVQMPVGPGGEESIEHEFPAPEEIVGIGLVTEEVCQAIQACMNALPHNQRIALALELARLDGQPPPQQATWATQNGFTASQYTSCLHQARQRMHECMQEWLQDA